MEIFWGLVLILALFGVTAIARAARKRNPGELSEAERETGTSHHMMGDVDRERVDNFHRLDPEIAPDWKLEEKRDRRGA